MPFFLIRAEATVAWKGVCAYLRQFPFPLPPPIGMQAQIPDGCTDTVAVVRYQGYRFSLACGRLHLPFGCHL
jgi:hypothetical protein